MATPYIIKVSSYKGGVGKTTTAVNLAVILKFFGASVLLIDSDTISPSVGFYLGLEASNIGYKQFISGRSSLRETVSVHAPTGLHVVVGAINAHPAEIKDSVKQTITNMVRSSNYDFVIIDTRPEIQDQNAIAYSDETIIVTTPDMPSATAAIKMATSLDKMGIKHMLVLNRIRGKKYELSIREIGGLYNGKLGYPMPEDDIVPISVEEHIPAYMLDSKSPFSRAIYRNAKAYMQSHEPGPQQPQQPAQPQKEGQRGGILSWFLSLFKKKPKTYK